MLQINQLKLTVEEISEKREFSSLKKKIAKQLRISEEHIKDLQIQKKSLDARKKPQLFYVYSVSFSLKDHAMEEAIQKRGKGSEVTVFSPQTYSFPIKNIKDLQPAKNDAVKKQRKGPVIIGMGPAGLFCAYVLARAGFAPILYERGKKVEERTKDVEEFWKNGKLLLHSNVQFGEGGAGTFSDGKLNTLIKDKTGRNKEVLRIFVENGAPENILYDSKPHIGTDVLSKTIASMRNKLLEWGAEIHYESAVTDFVIENKTLTGLLINHSQTIPVETVVLAIGHSARDTFEILYAHNIPMEVKDFAVGLRVQHPQEYIDFSQYGRKHSPNQLPASSYKLAVKTSVNRGVYSFCMCPGGYVVNASSEEKKLAINGMSYSGRDSGVANSAIILSVTKDDFCGEDALAGIRFQRELERTAFILGNGSVPVQYYHECSGVSGKRNYIKEAFDPRIKGSYSFCDLTPLFSESIWTAFREGMTQFGKIIPGFDDDFCLLAGVESRTSSPVRIIRNKDFESEISGLYPCGEGAGYAGGITSAAMDGLAVAEAIAKKYCI